MEDMATQERYIDADILISALTSMYVYAPTVSTTYGMNGQPSLDSMMSQNISNAVQTAMTMFKNQLAVEIGKAATLKGTPCFLCKQRDSDTLPENVYGCSKATSVG